MQCCYFALSVPGRLFGGDSRLLYHFTMPVKYFKLFTGCCMLMLCLAGCRTCPIEACHVRKVHLHEGIKYRGQPLWKKQNPAIGEKIKVHSSGRKKPSNDRSKPLK
jgi:hypothetical protein